MARNDAEGAGRIEYLRRALREGGKVILAPGHPPVPLDGQLAVITAQMVHACDTIDWERGGKQGPEPSLLALLHSCRINGKRLSEREWLDLVDGNPVLDTMYEELRRQMIDEDRRESRPSVLPDMAAHLTFTPRDVPRLRREIVDWLVQHGGKFYQDAVDDGRQQILVRPRRGLPEGEALAQAEAEAMRQADLYFIDADMCQLLAAAYPSMPPFAPRHGDLPSEHGFALFAAPLGHTYNRAYDNTPLGVATEDGFVNMLKDIHETGTQIIAASWRPYIDPQRARYWTAGGCWMTFYAIPATRLLAQQGGPAGQLYRLASESLPQVCPENEMVSAWYDPSNGLLEEKHFLAGLTEEGTGVWAKALLAAFLLARQANLAETVTERTPGQKLPKSVARRTGQKTRPAQDIRVVRLRQQVKTDHDAQAPDTGTAKSREYRHRWVVRGFWRNTWYPSAQTHRPQWIAPFLKGPAGAPLLGGQKVTLVTPPKKTVPES